MSFPLWSTPIVALIIWAAWLLERKYPVAELPLSEVLMDWKLVLIRVGVNHMIAPTITVVGVAIVSRMGGGLIPLRSDGWWFWISLIVVVLVTDLLAYLLHLANHKIPALWALHSLHHGAESLSIITGARHFWLSDAVNTLAFLVFAIVFKVPVEIAAISTYIHFLPCTLSHMNVRLSLGRFALVVNNPQYHRIHHSIEPQHRDKNLCQIFPIFDVIFGTAWKPGQDEFPMTGLVPSDKATSLDGLIWSFRQWHRDYNQRMHISNV